MQVGFIGLGTMGKPMAKNLLKAGFPLTVHNRSRGSVEELAGLGARAATSPRQVAEQAEVVLVCVPTPAVTEQVLLGPDGAVEGARAGQVFVDLGTSGVGSSRKIGAALAERGVAYLDAPVSGGPMGAEAGTLAIMVGGEREPYDRVLPVFQALGQNIYYTGPLGAGNVVKLVNQIVIGITQAAISEALVVGAKAGVDPDLMYEVVSKATGNSVMWTRSVPERILKGNFQQAFSIDLLFKDLELATSLGKDTGVPLPLTNLAQQLYEIARARGHGGEDICAVIRPLEEIVGIEVRSRAPHAGGGAT